MRNKKSKKVRAPRRGRLWPLVATLLTGVFVVLTLLGPRAVMAVHDRNILNTFYPTELRGGSLANPELAEAASLVDALSRLNWSSMENRMEEQDEAAARTFYEAATRAYTEGYVHQRFLAACDLMLFEPDTEYSGCLYTAFGLEFEAFSAESYYYDDYNQDEYHYFSVTGIQYAGKLVALQSHYYHNALDWEMELRAERVAASIAEGSGPAEVSMEEIYGYEASEEVLQRMMDSYIQALGLAALDDWRYNLNREAVYASSNYSLVELFLYYYGESLSFGVNF